ncbi:MAG TPA: hypothetical protein EYM79_05550 [Planctomycetes bacterium]|jgi:hypothetical protein|nr:hypothetical protein [Planctomycetota bacterium]|tara:strand:- start:768 stop:1232 length:465 start_codon:yes stop_codon:yes gene_type:complete
MNRGIQLLLDSFAVIFLLTGGAKLLNVLDDSLMLRVQDPVFSFMRSGHLHTIVELLELALASVILTRRLTPYVSAFSCALLSSAFLVYRLAIAFGDSGAYCGCLAGLDKIFGWSTEQASTVSLGILAYVLVGSYAALVFGKPTVLEARDAQGAS